jgi:hypothetical protein
VVLPHPPYTPSLVPYDFYYFAQLKGCHFKDEVRVQMSSNTVLQVRYDGFQKYVAAEGNCK